MIQIKFGQDGGLADVDVLSRGEQGPRMPDEARAKTFFGNDVTTSNGPNTGNGGAGGRRPVERTVELAEEMIANLGPGVDHRVPSAGHIVMARSAPNTALW